MLLLCFLSNAIPVCHTDACSHAMKHKVKMSSGTKPIKSRVGARKGDRRPGKGCSMYRIHLCGNQNSKELESLLSFIILKCDACACKYVGVPI